MYITKGYGLGINDIDWSCPSDMEPYASAKVYEENQLDTRNWQLGVYISHAVSLIGKGSYPDKPIFQLKEDKGKGSNDNEALAVLEMKMRAKMLSDILPPSPK